jgi:hypothetical protein
MKIFLLKRVVNWLVGGELFSQIIEIVEGLANETISSEEKRATAKRRIRAIGSSVSEFLINLALEAAVVILKSK